ncbi:MAG: twin-arginine translocase TatA/TatE family subunit [Sphingomonadaceae bacterium]
MNFLGLGPGEIFVILLLALIVFGPGKLPEIGAGIGKAIREFRRASDSITQEFTRELSLEAPPEESHQTTSTAATVAEEPQPPAAETGEPASTATQVGGEPGPAPEPIAEGASQPEPETEVVSPEPVERRRRVRRAKPATEEGAESEAKPAARARRSRKVAPKAEEGHALETATSVTQQEMGD